MKPVAKTWVEVSKSALTGNVKAFRSRLGKTALMSVVKSNAYGHGLVEAGSILAAAGADWLGVDNVDEGIALRRAGIKKPILVLGYTRKDRIKDAIRNGISFVVYNQEQVAVLKRETSAKNKARVHLEIETGITRQGLEGDDLIKLAKSLARLPHVVIEGAFTHFANIEDTTDASYAELQLKRFQNAVEQLAAIGVEPEWKHTACSAAAILFPETYFNLARVGISSYGLWPSRETLVSAKSKQRSLNLKPALTWKTIVAQVKRVKKGTPVSYGLTERVHRDSKIAVIPVGYWDGFDRGLSSVGEVLIRGARCKVIGRVCMNMCMVDVTDVAHVRAEDEVVLIGSQREETIRAEDLAAKLGTINYEVVTRINPTAPRILT